MAKWARLAVLLSVSWGLLACVRESGLNSKDNWERRIAVSRLKDQAQLEEIARSDSDIDARASAVSTLTDQAALARLALDNTNGYVRYLAAEKLTDQAVLAKIALDDRSNFVRAAAVRRLEDQATLAKVALNDSDSDDDKDSTTSKNVRCEAVARLTDQSVLAEVALGDRDYEVRQCAVEKLTDQSVLAKIALDDDKKGFLLRYCAVPRLTDQSVLAKVALGDRAYQVRARAVEHLEDQAVLAKVVEEDGNEEVRELANGRLTADGKQKLEQLRFEQIQNSEDRRRLQTFLSQYPAGPYTSKASSQLRKVLYRWAVADGSCGAYAEFLAEFPQDPGAGELRRKLAAKGQWEKAKRLGEMAVAMIPDSGIDEKGRLVNTNPTPLKLSLEQFRVLLAAGADPSAVRIKGFTPRVTVQDGRWESQYSGSGAWSITPDGSIKTDAFQQVPRPPRTEHPVPAAEGGLTLSEYSKANEGTWAEALGFENVDSEFHLLAQEAVRLLEQPDAKGKTR